MAECCAVLVAVIFCLVKVIGWTISKKVKEDNKTD